MSGYSESALLRKLAEVKISAPSIQGVALWIMHHKKHYRATVRTWYRHLVAAQSGHKLTLLYLANDVVQNCRKKQPEIEAEFGLVMKKVFTHLAGETLDEKIVTRMTRLVNVWKERAIFDRKVQEEVAKVWASRGKERGGSNGPPAKKAKVEKPTRELEEKEDAEEEEDVVSGLALVRRMATERERQGEGEEGSLARLEEEVRERRRLGEALADLVRRQQEELQQAEEQLVRMRARQCGYHQPKPHEVQRLHDFEQPIDYEELHEAGEPYDRYPPALPTKPHGARADGWGLEEENNENSVPAVDHSEAQIECSTIVDKPPMDDTVLSDELQDETAQPEQGEIPEEQLSSEEETAESKNENNGFEEGNTEPEQENIESDQGILGSGDLITNQLPTGEVDQGDEPENVDFTCQIQESEVDKQNQDTSATGFDSEPESDSDPNTLTEEAEGSLAAVGNGESMPILT